MNLKIKDILTRKRHILAIIVSLSIMISIGAFYYFSNEVKTIRSQAFNQLKSIATLKVSQISGWNNERFADAKVLSQNPFFEGDFNNLSRSKSVDPFKSAVIKNFKLINANSDYSNIILSGTKGNFLLSLDPKLRQIDSSTSRFIKIAVKDKKIIFTDFYKFSLNNEIFLDYIAPVIDKNNFVIAVVILRVNPENFLYPLIKEWPVPSKTSETLIVRREGGNVLYLNDLNHQGGASLKFTIPLTRKEVPAVQAVLGRKGFFEGVGYQGTNVLSYLSPVIGTPWIMVAKIDNSEIYAELYSKEIAAVLFTVLLILCLSGGIVWFYYYRQRNIYKELFVKEKELRAHHEEFKTILYSIGDGVITIDTNGNINKMNQTAEKLTGWNESEAKGKPVEEVFVIINETTRNRVENPFHKVLSEGIIVGLANHTLLISKNGGEIPIADSGAPIKAETGEILGVVLVFRDQIDERIAQKAVEESSSRFLSLFRNMNEGVALHELVMDNNNHPVNYRVIDVNPQFERILGINRLDILGKLATVAYNTTEAPYLEIYSKVALSAESYTFETYYDSMNKYFIISVVPWLQNGFATIFTDITDNKLAEEALRESEERFRRLFEDSSLGLYRTTPNGQILLANPALLKMLNYSSFEEIAKRDLEKSGIEASYNRKEFIKQIETNGEIKGLESAWTLNDGTMIYIRENARAVCDSNGKTLYFDGIIENITESKRAEEALLQSEERFRAVYNASPSAISISEIETGKLIEINEAYEKLFGYDKDEVLGKSSYELGLWINSDDRKQLIDTILNNGIYSNLEVKFKTKYDSIIDCLLSGRIVLINNKKFMVTIVHDITDLQNAALTVKESEERFRKIFEEHSAVKLLLDFATGNIVDANKAAAEYYGWTKEELLRMNINEINILSPDNVNGQMDKAMMRAKTNFEFCHRLKDGSVRDVEIFTGKVEIGGKEYLHSIIHDITDRKLAEEKLKKYSLELQQLNEGKDKLFSIIAHDLRGPFNPLLGLSDILLNDFESLTTEEIKDYNKEINNSLKNEYALLENLLNWSRLETGQMIFNPETINLYNKTKTVINLLLGNAKFKDITLVNGINKNIFISADPNMLHSLLQNLIANSIKFTDKGGSIKIYSEMGGNNFIRITVSDNGVGMTSDQLKDLFGPTAKSTKGTKDEKGTGLGLMICKGMVERHGGIISVKSDAGKGTDISFTLPKAE